MLLVILLHQQGHVRVLRYQGTVEGCQVPAVPARQDRQVRIRHLAVRGDTGQGLKQFRISQRPLDFTPEPMIGT